MTMSSRIWETQGAEGPTGKLQEQSITPEIFLGLISMELRENTGLSYFDWRRCKQKSSAAT
jgi:hypothetical protein